jgi:hypothetical protein
LKVRGTAVSEALQSAWYRLDLSGLPRAVVAVDASASAAAMWFGPVASVLDEIAEKLPPAAHPEVAFLGDRKTYPLAAILKGISSPLAPPTGPSVDVNSQVGRYPVLGPLLWELSRGQVRPLLVMANGPVLDAEDWAVPEVTGRTLVYRMTGADRATHPAFREVGPETELGVLVEHLRDPVTAVTVRHEAGLAVDWDNDAYTWDDGTLTWQSPAATDLSGRFLHGGDEPPAAVVKKAGGAVYRLPLVPVAGPADPLPVPLTPAEANVLNLWRRGTGFWCGQCSRTHTSGRVWCVGKADGPGLFPTLAATPAGAYLAEARANDWLAKAVRRGVVPVAPGQVLVSRPGAAAEYRFEAGRWEAFADDPGPFVPLDGGGFLIRPGPRG